MSRERLKLHSLTGLRGVAALAVVISHADSYGLSNIVKYEGVGTAAVAIFFSLSGFLMGLLYLNKPFTSSDVRGYAIARISRVAPAYLAVVICSFSIYTFVDGDFPFAIGVDNILRHLLFSGNQGVLWSIPPEIQFYAFFVLIWYSVSQSTSKNLTPVYLLSGVLVVCVLFSDSFPGTVVFSKITYFCFGVIAGYVRLLYLNENISIKAISLMQAGLVSFVAYILVVGVNYDNDEFWLDISNSIFVSFLVFSFSFSTFITRWSFESAWLKKLGEWSFSLYLTHVIVIYYTAPYLDASFLGTILALLITILFAAFFYYAIEKAGISLFKRILFRYWLEK